MYYIGLDVHKETISFCLKDAAGHVHQEGKIGATRRKLDAWVKTLPQPRMMAMEATIFTGWIYDHLLPRPMTTWPYCTVTAASVIGSELRKSHSRVYRRTAPVAWQVESNTEHGKVESKQCVPLFHSPDCGYQTHPITALH